MNPAFSAPQLRSFLNLFQDIGLKVRRPSHVSGCEWALTISPPQMCEKLKPEVEGDPDKTVFINKWLARTTLDIIGQGKYPAVRTTPATC